MRSGRVGAGAAVRGRLGAASRPRIASSTRRPGVGLGARSIVPRVGRGVATRVDAFSPPLPGARTSTSAVGAGDALTPPLLRRAGRGVSARRIRVTASEDALGSVATEPALRGWVVRPTVPPPARRSWPGTVRRTVTPEAALPPPLPPPPTPVSGALGPVFEPPAVTPTSPDRMGPPVTVAFPESASRLSLVRRDSFSSARRATKSVTSGSSLSEWRGRFERRTFCTALGFRQFRWSIPFVSVVMMPRDSFACRRRSERPYA